MNVVYVFGPDRTPLMPCSPVIARLLLKQGKAKVLRRTPFTIKLHASPATMYTQALTLGHATQMNSICKQLFKQVEATETWGFVTKEPCQVSKHFGVMGIFTVREEKQASKLFVAPLKVKGEVRQFIHEAEDARGFLAAASINTGNFTGFFLAISVLFAQSIC